MKLIDWLAVTVILAILFSMFGCKEKGIQDVGGMMLMKPMMPLRAGGVR